MNKSISSFFAPARSLNKKDAKQITKNKVQKDEDGWQIPIGLTVENAIEIDDSDVEEEVPFKPPTNIEDSSSYNKEEVKNSESATQGKYCEEDSLLYEGFAKEEDPGPMTKENKTVALQGGESTSATVQCSEAIDLCSPGDKPQRVSSMEDNTKQKDVIVSKAPNPFLQFAHDLGNSESSYFTELSSFHTSNELHSNPLKAKLKTNVSKCFTSTGARSTGTVSQRTKNTKNGELSVSKKAGKKRKRTFSKVDKEEIEFCDKSEEELEKCRQKWQSLADEDAPLEIRRFQVLIAARVHCQAHDQVARKVMASLRKSFRKDETKTSSSKVKGEGIDEKYIGNCDCEDALAYLSPETLSEADPLEISKIISSVLFANVKAKHIVQAAKEIKNQFRGKVPESKVSLKSIIGIGPKLAEVLFYVNSYDAYRK